MDKNNTLIKEIIFNDRKYSMTKKVLAIFYIALLFYSQFINNNKNLNFTLLFIGTIAAIIYFIFKINFYNKRRKSKDILFLIIFVTLLFFGIYTFYTLWHQLFNVLNYRENEFP